MIRIFIKSGFLYPSIVIRYNGQSYKDGEGLGFVELPEDLTSELIVEVNKKVIPLKLQNFDSQREFQLLYYSPFKLFFIGDGSYSKLWSVLILIALITMGTVLFGLNGTICSLVLVICLMIWSWINHFKKEGKSFYYLSPTKRI